MIEGITFLIAVVVIVVVQFLKTAISNTNLIPLLSVAIGLIAGTVASLMGYGEWLELAITGVSSGLIASGAYDTIAGLVKELGSGK